MKSRGHIGMVANPRAVGRRPSTIGLWSIYAFFIKSGKSPSENILCKWQNLFILCRPIFNSFCKIFDSVGLMAARIVVQKNDEIINHSGTARLTIEKDWCDITNLRPGKKIQKAICSGKHGIFLAVWAEDQPKDVSHEDVNLKKNGEKR